jgi:hypothetical protein
MAKKNAVRVTASTGNVFRDLGFSKEAQSTSSSVLTC